MNASEIETECSEIAHVLDDNVSGIPSVLH